MPFIILFKSNEYCTTQYITVKIKPMLMFYGLFLNNHICGYTRTTTCLHGVRLGTAPG